MGNATTVVVCMWAFQRRSTSDAQQQSKNPGKFHVQGTALSPSMTSRLLKRVRGTAVRSIRNAAHRRFSPACAGNRDIFWFEHHAFPVQPRVCGCQRQRDSAADCRSKSAAEMPARRPPISGAFLLSDKAAIRCRVAESSMVLTAARSGARRPVRFDAGYDVVEDPITQNRTTSTTMSYPALISTGALASRR